MLKITRAARAEDNETIKAMRRRAAETAAEINEAVTKIMADVCENGYEAVKRYSIKFDGREPYEVPAEELKKAEESCDPELLATMKRSAENIRAYQEKLLSRTQVWRTERGSMLGQIVRGIKKVGIYVPGGAAAYPSSVLMNAVPAKVAGVKEIIMVSPPGNMNTAVMAAASIAGVDRVIAVGGAHAVAALTYGAGFIPRVDKLVGPGNAFVAAAKRMAYGKLDIDMVAGPSEVLIIADDTAHPDYIAADLMSQAEHDPLASAILVTDSEEFARKVDAEIEKQIQKLERRDIIERSLRDYGAAFVCEDLVFAAMLANEIAPEHLEIVTKDYMELLPLIENAGAIFLGENTPEPLGDYMAGPSHVLPTSGTARFFSPLSVQSFLKRMSVIGFTDEEFASYQEDIIRFANAEGLTAHAASAAVRRKEGNEKS